MELLLTIHESDLLTESHGLDSSDFYERFAARAVVTNDLGQVALLKVGKFNYHKLPGGGVEQGENMSEALQRELLEEIGCTVAVTAEIGQTIEYRDRWKLKQTSNSFLARQIGTQGSPSFTEKELDDGFEIRWAKNLDEAIAILTSDEPTNYEGKFIQRRDMKILEAAKALL